MSTTADQVLLSLVAPAAEAVGGVLETFCPGAWSAEPPAVAADPAAALGDGADAPGLAFVATYAGGAAGAGAMVLTQAGVQKLAGVLMGGSADDPATAAPLTDLQSSAVEEAMGRLLGAVAGAIGGALGCEVAAGAVQVLPTGAEGVGAGLVETEHAAVTALEVCGQPARFVQLVPAAVVARAGEAAGAGAGAGAGRRGSARQELTRSLRTTTVRVSAEVGRTRLPVESIVGVPAGTVIELDREADEPVDIYVNGRRYATGRLVLTDTAEWAVRVERVLQDAAGA